MRVRKGYTAVELVVVLVIMSIILGAAFGFMDHIHGQFELVSEQSDKPIQAMRIVTTVETVVTGCSEIIVTPQEIEVVKPSGVAKVNISEFPNVENMVFALRGSTVVIDIGGEQYCIPVLKNY